MNHNDTASEVFIQEGLISGTIKAATVLASSYKLAKTGVKTAIALKNKIGRTLARKKREHAFRQKYDV